MALIADPVGLGDAFDAGDLGPEHSGQGQARFVLRSCPIMLAGEVDPHLIEPLIARNEPVKGIFMDGPDGDQQGHRHADSQTDNIDGTEAFAFEDISPGDENVIFEHSGVVGVKPAKKMPAYNALAFNILLDAPRLKLSANDTSGVRLEQGRQGLSVSFRKNFSNDGLLKQIRFSTNDNMSRLLKPINMLVFCFELLIVSIG